MLGNLGKGWVGGVVAVVLIAVAGGLMWRSCSESTPRMGAGEVVRICLKDGTRFLGPADPGAVDAKCPKCGGETVIARIFECHKGHIFVGFLERPPAPDSVKTDDVYAQHQPLLLRPGVDDEWAPGGTGEGPQCPECGTPMKRAVLSVKDIKLDSIQCGELPTAGGGN